jgi:uncharacterized protein YdiU (UPF0061 family)
LDNPDMSPSLLQDPVKSDALIPNWRWVDRYAQLGTAFHTPLASQPLRDPYWVAHSQSVAQQLGLPAGWMQSDEWLNVLSGNAVFAGSRPVATVYSGHQFGVWAGQLGDGRALLLGETEHGLEIQLKGAGRTPYSRMGDGRAVLRSSIREFLCSEAMHGLGIPTTRALCVIGSDDPVRREEIETSAVVARVAPSFIRFGHFEHFASLGQHAELRQLADFVIEHYYPECRQEDGNFKDQPYAKLLHAVARRTAELLAHWQAVGFCHGVMNTDNMSILGLTLDYGPFQFLDGYNPGHICNHSDTQGRYAFARQPNVAFWNLHCLAHALQPLIQDQELALSALDVYRHHYSLQLEQHLRAKLGWSQTLEGDRELLEEALHLLAAEKTDHTIFWRRLSHYVRDGQSTRLRDLFINSADIEAWLRRYDERMAQEDASSASERMLKTNPKFVLRNHLGELAIRQASQHDFSAVAKLQALLESPYDEHPGHEAEADFPPAWASSIEISCSS